MKKYWYMLAGTCILLSAIFAGCSDKEEIEWVMPSSTAQQEATDTDASAELTVEEAQELLESEFAGYEAAYVGEVTENGVECYRFLITDSAAETDSKDADADDEATDETVVSDTDETADAADETADAADETADLDITGDGAEEAESPYDMVSDYYDVAKEGGKLVGRRISGEKAEAILKDAFADDSLEFVPTGEIVTIYGLTYLEYRAVGIEDNIYITSTYGNEVFIGYYDETVGEWMVEIVATYGVNEEQH
ncbi:MAG: hypothetical protein LUE29_04575 [Lachnospiraceae bacterium]|nr:hypothetical protein [Lachnospiraceae bacterium]